MALSQWKEAILEGIFMEIEEGVVMEKNLDRLENLVEILQKEGLKVPESVKEAYCQVAVECTAKYLEAKEEAYTEAFKSIWLRRIMPLCDKVSCLVTRDLLNGCQRLWTAHNNEKECRILIDENTTEKALVSLRKVVLELHPNLDDRNENMEESEEMESSEETEKTESMIQAREIEVNQSSKASEDEESFLDTQLERPISEGSKAESLPCQIKTIPSVVVDRALRRLRASKIELVNSLKGEGPSNLNNETISEQENDVANPSATNTVSKRSLMERRSTAHTYEWEDSIDDSDEEMDDDADRNNKLKPKKVVVPPLKKTQSPEFGRRKKVPWCTAETLALMKGYEKYGANWKRIKDECPILFRRTNGDLKDKFRVEMKRQERQH